jgi:hypothetical protein
MSKRMMVPSNKTLKGGERMGKVRRGIKGKQGCAGGQQCGEYFVHGSESLPLHAVDFKVVCFGA